LIEKTRPLRTVLLSLLALGVILAILFFGLRPKWWSADNAVVWLPEKQSLRFEHPAIAYVDDLSPLLSRHDVQQFTITIEFTPATTRKMGFRPLLMIHDGRNHSQLAIWNWGPSLIVMNGDDYSYSKKLPRITARDALVAGESVLVSITSDGRATALFVNGALAAEREGWALTLPASGNKIRLIFGNSVYGRHGWDGEIRSFALHAAALTHEEVKKFRNTSQQSVPAPGIVEEELLLSYAFREYGNQQITDVSGNNLHVLIPEQIVVLKKEFLSAPASFKPNHSFYMDVLLNLSGFIVLGAVVYLWLSLALLISARRSAITAAVICFLLSLFMETLQTWMPGRDSSLLDLTTNSVGAIIGIIGIMVAGRSGNRTKDLS
jgi:VanZ family protein